METLIQQINEKKFKPSNFSVYSILEEDGFIGELQILFNTKYSVDDFEYILIDLSVKEKNGIKYCMSFMTDKIAGLRNLLEVEIQDDPKKSKVRVYVDKEKFFIFVAKLKDFDLHDRLKKTKICDDIEISSQI